MKVINYLCETRQNKWMEQIPKGLITSYRYLYQCVTGLGSVDANVIER